MVSTTTSNLSQSECGYMPQEMRYNISETQLRWNFGVNVGVGERQQDTNQSVDARPYHGRTVKVEHRLYKADKWSNVPPNILSAVPRRLHLLPNHPISITRQIIESRFPTPEYKYYNNLSPVVSVAQNFDSLGFPADHPGRSRTDTYYINHKYLLRTHTSAHQVDTFRANKSAGFLISADVYRRDAIDRSHYPIFHQMEGARLWDRSRVPGGNIAEAVWNDLKKLPRHDLEVEDPNPVIMPESNPLQAAHHTTEEAEAIAAHLKRTLELVVEEIFSRARQATVAAGYTSAEAQKPLRIRWVPAYFPFTSPSWELEVFWNGDWLEVLGSGIVKQELLVEAGVPTKLGWAFGLGIERIAMLLFSIPDIRLFWSKDPRFLSQFSVSAPIARYAPFSKYPACYKDVAFWLPHSSPTTATTSTTNTSDSDSTTPASSEETSPPLPPPSMLHSNDVMEIVRDVAGDTVEDVLLVDTFIHPTTGRTSQCYRINYRSLERTLTNVEANEMHEEIRQRLVQRFGVLLR